MIGAGFQRHHHLFQRAIARALADAVDRAFDLPGAAANRGQAVGDRHAEIVMAMGRKDDVTFAADVRGEVAEQIVHFLRAGVTHRVGDVEHIGPGIGGDLQRLDQKIALGADRVLGGKFDLPELALGRADRAFDLLQHLVAVHPQLRLAVERAGADEQMEAVVVRRFQRTRGGLDIAVPGTRERADDGAGDLPRHLRDRFGIAGGGGGEAGLHHVDVEIGERAGDTQFVRGAHRKARRLLAVAQGGIEDGDAAYIAYVGGFILLRHGGSP